MAGKSDCIAWLGETNMVHNRAMNDGHQPGSKILRVLKEAKGFFQEAIDAEGNANERDFYYENGKRRYNDAAGML